MSENEPGGSQAEITLADYSAYPPAGEAAGEQEYSVTIGGETIRAPQLQVVDGALYVSTPVVDAVEQDVNLATITDTHATVDVETPEESLRGSIGVCTVEHGVLLVTIHPEMRNPEEEYETVRMPGRDLTFEARVREDDDAFLVTPVSEEITITVDTVGEVWEFESESLSGPYVVADKGPMHDDWGTVESRLVPREGDETNE